VQERTFHCRSYPSASQFLALFGVNQFRTAPELEAKTIILLSISRPGAFNRLIVIAGMKIVAVADAAVLIKKIAPIDRQSHGRLLSLSRLALRQPDTWPAAVLVGSRRFHTRSRAVESSLALLRPLPGGPVRGNGKLFVSGRYSSHFPVRGAKLR
jgi:hypothetical protein